MCRYGPAPRRRRRRPSTRCASGRTAMTLRCRRPWWPGPPRRGATAPSRAPGSRPSSRRRSAARGGCGPTPSIPGLQAVGSPRRARARSRRLGRGRPFPRAAGQHRPGGSACASGAAGNTRARSAAPPARRRTRRTRSGKMGVIPCLPGGAPPPLVGGGGRLGEWVSASAASQVRAQSSSTTNVEHNTPRAATSSTPHIEHGTPRTQHTSNTPHLEQKL